MTEDRSTSDIGVEQPPANPPTQSGVVGAMMVAVLVGGLIGAGIALVFLPDLVAAAAVGGAMTAGALRVFVFMSSNRKGLTPVDDEDGSMQ